MILEPKMIEEVQAAVQEAKCLGVRGQGTKPALAMAWGETAVLSTRHLSGILAYEPNEYTFTAYAGTAVSEVITTLAQNNQYLPFDPLWVEAGATLGGTVAANASGSGRYRYGGVRDFILGVSFVDGSGQLVRGGGKVVKNSAGFDIPKFMVGSLGRYGILVELTFKVFPKPRSYVTLQLQYASLHAALFAMFKLAVMPFEMDVLDLAPELAGKATLIIRLGGLPEALPGRVERMRGFLQEQTEVETAVLLENEADITYWQAQNRFDWAFAASQLVKIPVTPKQIPTLDKHLTNTLRRYSAGGNVAWVAADDMTALQTTLTELNLAGLQFTGHTDDPYLGSRKGRRFAQRIKKALDPNAVFSTND
ncbi:MAG: FAD-binding oxidoreductase [Chloroflexi bacterium]|nr:MAG: FAD-binding oxidoreductase [Chloroflexota bacterium]